MSDFGDPCYAHSRESFHELVGLLHLNLYVDFPKYTDACHRTDPQLAKTKTAQLLFGAPSDQTSDLSLKDVGSAALAITGGIFSRPPTSVLPWQAQHLATFYLFTSSGGSCKAPIINGGGGGG